MKRSHLAAFALAATVTAFATAEEAAEPKRILDFELRRLERMAEKFEVPAEKRAALAATLKEHDAARRANLEALAGELAALDEAVDAGADPLAALETLDARRKAMRDARVAKMDAMGDHFTEHQKLKLLARMHRAREERAGPFRQRVGGFLKKHAGTVAVKILGVEQATFDAAKAYFESGKTERQALKAEFEGIRPEIKAYLETGEVDEARAAQLVARLKDFRAKVHDAIDAHLAGAKEALTPAQRAEITTKVVAGVRKLVGLATYFWDVEELKLFL